MKKKVTAILTLVKMARRATRSEMGTSVCVLRDSRELIVMRRISVIQIRVVMVESVQKPMVDLFAPAWRDTRELTAKKKINASLTHVEMEGRARKWMMGSNVRAPPSTKARLAKLRTFVL